MLKIDRRYKSHHDALGHYGKYKVVDRSNAQELELFLDENTPSSDKLASIYFHIPFCDKICSFCNLNRGVLKEELDDYVKFLISKIEWYGSKKYTKNSTISSIYFGGGTPTVMNADHFKLILDAVRTNFKLVENCEISVETTLHNLGIEKLLEMEKSGVNRISIGIQTFSTEGRKFFNRTYNKEQVIEKITEIKDKFKGMVCIDKIYNYPGETIEDLNEDIRLIQELDIQSISFYSLMIHEGSALSKKYTSEDLKLKQDQQYHDHFVDTLVNTGDYEVLELTKIVKKGTDNYQYIQVRNSLGDVFPIGKGAGGNIGQFDLYQVNPMILAVQKNEDDFNYQLNQIYGRLQKGRFNLDTDLNLIENKKVLKNVISKYIDLGYVEQNDNKYNMTKAGLFYGNNISAYIIEDYYKQIKGE